MAFSDVLQSISNRLDSGKTWQSRLKKGSITTPDGKTYKFDFEDVEVQYENKTSVYKFSEKPGAYVQNFGLGETKYPLTVYITGKNYDKTANAFDKSLSLKGHSKMQHPRYGVKKIVIHGWSRQDNEKSAAGLAVYSLTISETITLSLGLGFNLLGSFAKLAAFISAVKNAMALIKSTIDTATALVNSVTAIVDSFSEIMASAVAEINSINDSFVNLTNSIKDNINTLVNTPELLADSLSQLFFLPAATSGEEGALDVNEIVNLYIDMYDMITSLNPVNSNDQNVINQSILIEATASFCVAGIAQAYQTGKYLTVNDSINAIETLSNTFVENQQNIDTMKATANGNNLIYQYSPSDTSLQALKDFVTFTSAVLLDIAFSSKKEVIKRLNRDYTIIDLCYELYNTVAETERQFLIDTNQLTGERLLIIPKGTDIKYYV